MGFEQLVKGVSSRWRQTTPEERAKYEAEAKKDNRRYYAEMDEYRARTEVQSAMQSEQLRRRKV